MSELHSKNDFIDLQVFHNMTDCDPDLEKELFEIFIDSAKKCIAVLANNCDNMENEPWRKEAHALKGISISVGTFHLSKVCNDAQKKHTSSTKEKGEML